MGVAQKTMFSISDRWVKFFGISGAPMEHNTIAKSKKLFFVKMYKRSRIITRRPKFIDYIFFTFDFSRIWVYFPFYGKPYVYYDIGIMALGRPFHRKNIIFF